MVCMQLSKNTKRKRHCDRYQLWQVKLIHFTFVRHVGQLCTQLLHTGCLFLCLIVFVWVNGWVANCWKIPCSSFASITNRVHVASKVSFVFSSERSVVLLRWSADTESTERPAVCRAHKHTVLAALRTEHGPLREGPSQWLSVALCPGGPPRPL